MLANRGRIDAARAFLGRVADACRDCLIHYIRDHEPGRRFERYVLLGLAAVDQAARTETLERADLRFVAEASADAAAVCRTQPPDETILAVAGCFEEAALVCGELLGEHDAGAPTWLRFLFEDADFEAMRRGGGWRLRRGVLEAHDRWFDAALEAFAPALSNHRVAELTVHVLDWHAQAEAFDD
jgi:hypothetical protein